MPDRVSQALVDLGFAPEVIRPIFAETVHDRLNFWIRHEGPVVPVMAVVGTIQDWQAKASLHGAYVEVMVKEGGGVTRLLV